MANVSHNRRLSPSVTVDNIGAERDLLLAVGGNKSVLKEQKTRCVHQRRHPSPRQRQVTHGGFNEGEAENIHWKTLEYSLYNQD